MDSLAIPQSSAVAGELKQALLRLLSSRRNGRFTDADEAWGANGQIGSLASLQGLRTAFGLLLTLSDDEEVWSISKPHFSSLIDEWVKLLEDPEAAFKSCAPYNDAMLQPILLEEGAGKARSSYVDAVAWSVSTAVAINFLAPSLQQRGIISAEIKARTLDFLVAALKELVALQLPGGGWNWGRALRFDEGHLYFTWTAMQALADVFDYIDGESFAEIGIERDDATSQFLKSGGIDIETIVKPVRKKAVEFLAALYLDPALRGELDETVLMGRDKQQNIRIEVAFAEGALSPRERELSLLYFYSYLQEALILGSYDNDFEGGKLKLRQLQDVLRARYSAAIRLIIESTDDRNTLAQKTTARVNIRAATVRFGKTAEFPTKDPCLWPQMLRTFVLYAYYVEPDAPLDPYIIGSGSAYEGLRSDRIIDGEYEGLWDQTAFNLAVTSRAVEGLIDVYDYTKRLEEKAATPPIPPPKNVQDNLARALADALYPLLQERLREMLPSASVEGPSSKPSSALTPNEFSTRVTTHNALTFQNVKQEVADALFSDNTPNPIVGQSTSVEGIAKKAFGNIRATAFSQRSPESYEWCEVIASVAFLTFVGCFEQLMEAAALRAATPQEYPKLSAKIVSSDGRQIGTAAATELRKFAMKLVDDITSAPPATPAPSGRKRTVS